jgi:NAD-dependent dihydropyrimidine dehydrogenase PreA subunit
MAVEKIDTDTCIGCGTCVATCPMDVLRMDSKTGKSSIAYVDECQICKLCVKFCPVNAITVTHAKSIPPMIGWA